MSASSDLEQLKRKLIASLQTNRVDYDQVIALSSQIAQLDPDYVRFTVDAGHISRLGRELVGRQETAVTELVKNAYDADATRVRLDFQNADAVGGTLVISDNGHGMTRDQLVSGFMRLSSTDKIHNPTSPTFRRQRAGRKGIGRFAAQRLGERLKVVTETTGADVRLTLTIDWSKFQGDTNLEGIANRVEQEMVIGKPGTALVITKLAEAWNDAAMTRIYRYLIDLLQPFPLGRTTESSKIDPGFDITVIKSIGKTETVVASAEKMVYEFALAEVAATVDDLRTGSWSIKSERFDIDELHKIGNSRDNPDEPFNYVKDVRLKAYYYIYNSSFIPRTQNGLIRDLALERGGIRVYRNGFRVLPYGEPLNDWLELDASSARRTILPPHANINFFGFVEIHDPQGKLFEETASREGLIENDAYHELVNWASRVLNDTALRIAQAREKKQTAGQKGWAQAVVGPTERLNIAIRQASDLVTQIITESPKSASSRPVLEALQTSLLTLQEANSDQEAEKITLIHELGMLRVLSSMGLTIAEFAHEIRHLLPPIVLEAENLAQLSESTGNESEHARRLISHINAFRTYTSYFDKAVSENARREMRPQELGVTLRNFRQTLKPTANGYAIDILEPQVVGYDLFTVSMHASEWISMLLNLFSNSKKAIQRAGTKGTILLRAGRDGENVFVDFADNGDGIPGEIQERIFDAFFTTGSASGALANEQEESMGSGLGLKIIRDTLIGYRGDIELVGAPESFSTCFRITLPKATEQEINNFVY